MVAARIIQKPPYLNTTDLVDFITTFQQLLNTDASINEEVTSAAQKAANALRVQSTLADIPHGQFSTLLLLEARLSHLTLSETPSYSSPFVITSPYLLAFSQFVSGYCDIARVRTTGSRVGPSMYDVAATIGMPEEFIAFRHTINHQKLPGLYESVTMWKKAMTWLLAGYWKPLCERVQGWETRVALIPPEQASVRVDQALRKFLKARKSEVRAGQDTGAASEAVKSLYLLISQSNSGEDLMVETLLRAGMLVPSERGISSAAGVTKSSVLIWDSMLIKLSLMLPKLSYLMLLAMSIILNSADGNDAPTQRQNVIQAWTSRILDSDGWELVRRHHLLGVDRNSLHLP